MILRVATLCDAATSRENLLNVVGGGITTLSAAQLPLVCPLNVALLFEFERGELKVDASYVLEIAVEDPEGGVLSQESLTWGVSDLPDERELPIHIPVPASLSSTELTQTGVHKVVIRFNGENVASLPFRVSKKV